MSKVVLFKGRNHIILVGIQTVVPYLVKQTVVFVITIPEKFVVNETLKSF
jgi:hypothetical protein